MSEKMRVVKSKNEGQFTTFFTTFEVKDMPRYANLCGKMQKINLSLKCREVRKIKENPQKLR